MKLKSVLILLVLIGTALGQPPGGDMPPTKQNMDAIRIWKLTEVLELTEDQVTSFLPLVQIHERELRAAQQEMVNLIKEGHALQKENEVTQKAVDKFTKKYMAHHAEVFKIKNDFIKSLPKHLTPEQQILYLSFEARFRKELREYMKNERRGENRRNKRDPRRK